MMVSCPAPAHTIITPPTPPLRSFSSQDRGVFESFVEDKLAAPLKALSPLGVEGVELFAEVYAGEDLK